MAADLDEIRERIALVQGEITELSLATHNFVKGNIELKHTTPKLGLKNYYIIQKKPVPVAIKSRAGMLTNELRSCLDALASTLAIRNRKDPDRTYFPISKSLAVFKDDGMRKIKALSATDQDTIIGLKPYREASPLLFGLHEADRTRKHTRLIGAFSGGVDVQLGEPGHMRLNPTARTVIKQSVIGSVFIEDMEFFGVPILESIGQLIPIATNAPVALDLRISLDVTYSEPVELRGMGVAPSLAAFTDKIIEIVDLFG
jgi:hypothetical protein